LSKKTNIKQKNDKIKITKISTEIKGCKDNITQDNINQINAHHQKNVLFLDKFSANSSQIE